MPPGRLEFARRSVPRGRLVKLLATSGKITAVAYWGGTLRLFELDQPVAEHRFPQDITALAWFEGCLIVGDADGGVTALKLKP